MDRIIAAFATDDGQRLVNRHFGDAEKYLIYEITPSSANRIGVIENTTEEERQHGDPDKAKGINRLMKKRGVQVLVSKKFGANIEKMKKQYVCTLVGDEQIDKGIKAIQDNFTRIVDEWQKGEQRHFLNLKIRK